jgi:hypothetical protein
VFAQPLLVLQVLLTTSDPLVENTSPEAAGQVGRSHDGRRRREEKDRKTAYQYNDEYMKHNFLKIYFITTHPVIQSVNHSVS